MKIVLAFDSFKGSLSALESCHAATQAIHSVLPQATVIQLPLSDGGEGLVACLGQIIQTSCICVEVHDPLMNKMVATYALSADGREAFMEMAATSGLTLLSKEQRNPLITTTYGVGELIADAIERGCQKITIGLGGSATCDGGQGMIDALKDRCIPLPTACTIVAAYDVANPLFGSNGAAYIFAPQKGASPTQVVSLDKRLKDFAHTTEKAGIATPEMAMHSGAGAAGGLGYALATYLNATLTSGIDLILNLAHFEDTIRQADLVITGEGLSDKQTLMGKVAHGVLKRCQKMGVPVWLLSGAIDDADECLSQQFNLVCSINANDHRPLSTLMQKHIAKQNLEDTLRQKLRLFL